MTEGWSVSLEVCVDGVLVLRLFTGGMSEVVSDPAVVAGEQHAYIARFSGYLD